ncbi:Alkylated DNA repair protein alkB 8 [Mactra antiquata]
MADSGKESKKGQRKVEKKLSKLRQNLKEKEEILHSDFPTLVLCVCNGGLDNSVTYSEILELFGGSEIKCDVIMIPQKSYCFVSYDSINMSEEACKRLNGSKLAPTESRKNEVILYTLFVKEVPKGISPSNVLPPGLILLTDIISDKYAAEIMESVNFDAEENSVSQQLKHRRVKHYGYEFKYSINNVDPDEPLNDRIPVIFKHLLEKLLEKKTIKFYPDQLTVNQYQPGQGIPPHVDTPSAFEDGLVSLSLGSQVVMEFRHPDGRHLSVLLPPRSALIMTGESRYTWSHGITPRKSDIVTLPNGRLTLIPRGVRTSFTFRKITGIKPTVQVSEQHTPNIPCDESTAVELEKLHVNKVYEEIADHFSGTRHTPWPNIVGFLNEQPDSSMLADIGCGNGKYLGINKTLYEVGSDRSFNLAQIVQSRNYQVYVGDVLAIPLRENMFDVCLCIAVIHHLSTEDRRQRAVAELLKILRVGGKALIYVWAMEQELNKVKSKYLKKNKNNESADTNTDDKNNATGYHGNTDVNSKAFELDNVTDCKENAEKTDEESNSDNVCNIGDKIDEVLNTDKENIDICDNEIEAGNSSENTNPNMSQKLHVHVNRTQFQQQDLLVPWQLKNGKSSKTRNENTFHRFYHVFTKGELETLCIKAGNCRILKSYYDQGNWAVVLEKL